MDPVNQRANFPDPNRDLFEDDSQLDENELFNEENALSDPVIFQGISRASRFNTGILNHVEDKINSSTVIRKTIKWDKGRIGNKLRIFEKIGGKPILLKTSSSNISASFFTLESFFKSLADLGGKLLEFNPGHPFLLLAKPVHLILQGEEKKLSFPAVRIPFIPPVRNEFENMLQFSTFCSQMHYVVVWEEDLKPVSIFNSKQELLKKDNRNLLILPSSTYQELMQRKEESNAELQIKETTEFEGSLSFFNPHNLSGSVIVFESNSKQITSLFTSLRLPNTPFQLFSVENKLFLINISTDQSFIKLLGLEHPFFTYELKPLPTPTKIQPGTVILSMNQSASYLQYPDEILTFLLEGVNVFAYDNAGKGLSEGDNSQQGLQEAVEASGDFILSEGFTQEQMMFKGQCTGALPSSAAAITFPSSHIWIDQAPKNYHGTVGDKYLKSMNIGIENSDPNASYSQKAYSFFASATSSVISYAISFALPSFDVITNLDKNTGTQLYTIGIPDDAGHGGDQLVPIRHREKIREFLSQNPKGYYLPMPKATHITHWWFDTNTYTKVHQILQETKLSSHPLSKKNTRPSLEIISEKYHLIFGKEFDLLTATPIEHQTLLLLAAVVSNDMEGIETAWTSLRVEMEPSFLTIINTVCLSIAKETKNGELILLFTQIIREMK